MDGSVSRSLIKAIENLVAFVESLGRSDVGMAIRDHNKQIVEFPILWSADKESFLRLDGAVCGLAAKAGISIPPCGLPPSDPRREKCRNLGSTGLPVSSRRDKDKGLFFWLLEDEWKERLSIVRHAAEAQAAASPVEWSQEDSPSRWAKAFGLNLKTLKKRIEDGKIMVDEMSDRRWRIAIKDLPTGKPRARS